ncbi:MAG: hypothetical protein FD180_3838 [Planctomycetota bacterium]|nr:MAG: hypothetical protein FD180_3838 [Planctomycetota bacterium]
MLRIAFLASLLALPVQAEDANDDSASALKAYTRAVKNMNKSDGYHLDTKIDVDMGGAVMPGGSVEGTIRNPDFGHFKLDIAGNALDVFKEGDAVALLNPQTGKWEGQSSNQTLDFFIKIFNLGKLMDDLRDGAVKAEFGDPEDLGKRECRIVGFGVSKATLKKLIQGNGKDSLGVSADNATMNVRTWIDRKEGLPRKIAIVIDVELKGLPGADEGTKDDWEDWDEEKDGKKDGKKDDGAKEPAPKDDGEEDEGEPEIPPMKIAITVTASIKKYGQDLDVEVPAAARKVLDAQKKTETEPGGDEKDNGK